MYKKYISLMVILTLLSSMCFTVYSDRSEGVKSINEAMDEASVVLDFENTTKDDRFGFSDISTGDIVNNQTGRGYSMNIGKALKNIEPVSEGRYLISFEINEIPNKDTSMLVRLLGYDHGDKISGFDNENQYEVNIINSTTYTYYEYLNGIRQGSWKRWVWYKGGDISADETNRIDIYLDMTERRTYHFLNNELVREEVMPPQLKTLYGFYFSNEKGNLVLDNVIFSKVTDSIKKNLDALGVNYPEAWKGSLNIALNETEFGNNFYGNTPDMEFSMVNESDTACDYELLYEFQDEFGQIVHQQNETLSFKAGESKIHKTKLSVNRYGVMTMTVTAKGPYNTAVYKKNVALIKKPEKRNYVMGFCLPQRITHYEYYEEIIDLFAEGGFSNIRFGVSNSYRTREGDRLLYYDWEKTVINAIKKNKLDLNMHLSGGLTDWQDMPRNEETLAQWKLYCKQMAEDMDDGYGGEVSYEVWNEPNTTGPGSFNPYGTPQDYVNLARAAKEAIKAHNPNSKIMVGSLSGISISYMNKIIEANGHDTIDCVTLHPYMWMQGPETGNMFPQIQNFQKLLDDNGLGDRPVWWTEIGWYTHVGIPKQAIYTAQMFLLNEVNGKMADRIQIFDATDDDRLPRETFGLINSSIDYEPFMARPAFLAMTNFADIMTDAEYVETISYDAMQNLYRFKLADGKDALVFWTKDANNQIALDLGVSEVSVCDLYGNRETQSGIDGKYQFDATIYPQYVIGDFSKLEISEKLFDVSKDAFNVVNHDKADFEIDNKTDKTVEVSVATSKNIMPITSFTMQKEAKTVLIEAEDIENARKKDTVGGSGIIHASVIKEYVDSDAESIDLRIFDGEKLLYKKRMNITCVPSISVEHYIAHDIGDRWQYIIETTNNTYDTPLAGNVGIEAPASFAKYISSWNTGTVAAGAKVKTKIPIPYLIKKSETGFVGKLTMSDGETADISQELSYRGIPKINVAPKIDGRLDEGEWPSTYMIKMNEKSGNPIDICGVPYSGDDDMSADIYMCFDNKNLYFAARVRDDIHLEDKLKRLWAGDSFQFNVALERSSTAAYTELGLALVDGVPTISRTSGLIAMGIGEMFPNELQIVRNEAEKETIYELSIPFTEIYPPTFDIRDFSTISVSILLNDRDNPDTANRDKMFEYGGGVGPTKNPSLYYDYSLIR